MGRGIGVFSGRTRKFSKGYIYKYIRPFLENIHEFLSEGLTNVLMGDSIRLSSGHKHKEFRDEKDI